ncbi:hypothetical protein ACQ4PT_026480 [Festuca glaucescens]
MGDFSTRLSRSLSTSSITKVRHPEEMGGFSTRLSRSLPDLGKTFLEKKITFLEELKSDLSRYEGCYADYDYYDRYEAYFGDGDYDDIFSNTIYEGFYGDGDYDEIFSNTFSNRSAPTDSSPDLFHVPSNLETMLQEQSSTPHDIPLQDLKEITDNFSDERKLGQGGFGVVYKGVLRNGEIIAVKKIVSSLMPGLQKQFESEVYHLMTLKHPNIVRCLGYCYEIQNTCVEYNGKYVFAETAERLLCLEYLPKGSLDKYLSDESSRLDWSTRYKIIEGICYGLCHLHEQIDKPIIHLDLKPANILLDDNLVPKITDFGLSRLLGKQQTICTSSRIGTFGYMAPEFLHGGTITPKLDIFSLGVIIMEIITGHRDYPGVTGTSSDDFIELALDKWRYGSLEMDCEQIKRCIQVGLICVNPDRTKRPPMEKIINMLQGSENIGYDITNEAALSSG